MSARPLRMTQVLILGLDYSHETLMGLLNSNPWLENDSLTERATPYVSSVEKGSGVSAYN